MHTPHPRRGGTLPLPTYQDFGTNVDHILIPKSTSKNNPRFGVDDDYPYPGSVDPRAENPLVMPSPAVHKPAHHNLRIPITLHPPPRNLSPGTPTRRGQIGNAAHIPELKGQSAEGGNRANEARHQSKNRRKTASTNQPRIETSKGGAGEDKFGRSGPIKRSASRKPTTMKDQTGTAHHPIPRNLTEDKNQDQNNRINPFLLQALEDPLPMTTWQRPLIDTSTTQSKVHRTQMERLKTALPQSPTTYPPAPSRPRTAPPAKQNHHQPPADKRQRASPHAPESNHHRARVPLGQWQSTPLEMNLTEEPAEPTWEQAPSLNIPLPPGSASLTGQPRAHREGCFGQNTKRGDQNTQGGCRVQDSHSNFAESKKGAFDPKLFSTPFAPLQSINVKSLWNEAAKIDYSGASMSFSGAQASQKIEQEANKMEAYFNKVMGGKNFASLKASMKSDLKVKRMATAQHEAARQTAVGQLSKWDPTRVPILARPAKRRRTQSTASRNKKGAASEKKKDRFQK